MDLPLFVLIAYAPQMLLEKLDVWALAARSLIGGG
jgi:hypothetical protein